MFDEVLKHRSGRVIALGRLLLAAIFLLAIWMDPSQPAQAASETYAALAAYVAVAAILTIITWNNWWLDAKLAAPAHVLDIAAFTLLVLVTEGYTSPFFLFFVFLILSSAIRWDWRETTTTAAAVTLLYLGAGLFAGPTAGEGFELQRFIIRSGHLVILSAILIWFGVNQGFSGLKLPKGNFLAEPTPDRPPMTAAAEGAMKLIGAKAGLLLWRPAGSHEALAISLGPGETRTTTVPRSSVISTRPQPFLFDLGRNRAITRGPERRMRFFAASSAIGADIARRFGVEEGLALPINTAAGEGKLLLGGIKGLSTDHIELGAFLGDAITTHIQRHALLAAVEESAIARARLSLARDLHDSIVQFLAGATFRIEAITRALRAGEHPERELKDLKELMLLEQQELRSAIGALRSDRIVLPELAADLGSLCDRLGRQWDIRCTFAADVPGTEAPMRLHLDTHQLIREAVANAVRHARAKAVQVQMTVEESELRLDITNDGSGSERLKAGDPWSLRERVDEANGTLMLATGEKGTRVSITLPLASEQPR
ncbi:sensor histidine kinase [soil metagenome]